MAFSKNSKLGFYFEILAFVFCAQIKAIVYVSFLMGMFILPITGAFFFPIPAVAIGCFVGAPATFLGTIVSVRLIRRGIYQSFVWIVIATIVGGSWFFFLQVEFFIYYGLVCSPITGFFMSSYAKKHYRE